MDTSKFIDIIFDVDGTLADGSHRQHHLASKPRNWKAYQAARNEDTPHEDIIDLFKLYSTSINKQYRINICTGRGEDEREDTVSWLERYGIFEGQKWANMRLDDMNKVQDEYWPIGIYYGLYMRTAGDYRSDDIIKLELLEQMRAQGFNPVLAIDDRDRVVKAWRAAGLRCIQVREGAF
jgi:hypothetical protein